MSFPVNELRSGLDIFSSVYRTLSGASFISHTHTHSSILAARTYSSFLATRHAPILKYRIAQRWEVLKAWVDKTIGDAGGPTAVRGGMRPKRITLDWALRAALDKLAAAIVFTFT